MNSKGWTRHFCDVGLWFFRLSWENPFDFKGRFGMILNWSCGQLNGENDFLKKTFIVPWNYGPPPSRSKGCVNNDGDCSSPMEMLKKATSGVLALLPCSRTKVRSAHQNGCGLAG